MQSTRVSKGFTLLELLIVIAILAILGAVAIFVLNPAETLRETRDTQRISDLATLKTAIALFVTKSTSTVYLDGNSNVNCRNGATPKIFYSVPSDTTQITDITFDSTGINAASSSQATSANYTSTDGTGWIKLNLSSLVGGSPISDMPVDPTNTIGTASAVTSTDYVYRFACQTDTTFEVNAQLESTAIGARKARDGGNNALFYEVGTRLSILGTGGDF